MRQSRFADTSFYVALVSKVDENHELAKKLADLPGSVVTTDLVLLETANFLVSRRCKAEFLGLHDAIGNDRRTPVIPASRRLFLEGIGLFSERRDKSWSLTDCTSIVVMQNLGLSDVLTADHHFAQAGMNALML